MTPTKTSGDLVAFGENGFFMWWIEAGRHHSGLHWLHASDAVEAVSGQNMCNRLGTIGDVLSRSGILEHSMNVKIRQKASSPVHSYPGLHNRYSRPSQIPTIFWIECRPWPRNSPNVNGIYHEGQHRQRRQGDMFGPYRSVRTQGTWKHEWQLPWQERWPRYGALVSKRLLL